LFQNKAFLVLLARLLDVNHGYLISLYDLSYSQSVSKWSQNLFRMQIVPPLSAGSEINVARWHFALQRKSHLESSIGSLTASTVTHMPRLFKLLIRAASHWSSWLLDVEANASPCQKCRPDSHCRKQAHQKSRESRG
jgi:hypothetical protein